MTICPADNSTLFVSEEPLWPNGQTFHTLGQEIALGFGGIATVISLVLVVFHATHYSRPYEQKHIIRILMMIPVYAVISFLSFHWYKYATYWQVIRDCYEAFAIASFFTLLCHYIAPNLHEQKNYFRTATPKNWFWGVFGLQKITGGQNRGPFRKPRSGLTWFNVVWIGIFQYCFIRVLCTIMALVTELLGRYCEHSINPAYGHFWYQILTAISVTVAMFCVIQFYIQTKEDLAEHKPFLKVLCIKLVIFFSFWQQLVISFLASQYGPLKPSAKLNAPDINIGIAAVLIDFEMAFFAVMHIFAFSWRPYARNRDYAHDPTGSSYEPKYFGGFLGIKAYFDALNPWDIVKASARGFRWLFVGYRHRETDPSYQSKAVDDYMTTTHTVGSEVATELRPSDKRYKVAAHGVGISEDDRTGLLQSSGTFAKIPSRTNSPYQTYTHEDMTSAADSEFDITNPEAFRPGKTSEDYGSDLAYHGAPQSRIHPALRTTPPREVHVHDPNWNMLGGPYTPPVHNEEYPARI